MKECSNIQYQPQPTYRYSNSCLIEDLFSISMLRYALLFKQIKAFYLNINGVRQASHADV